MQVDIQNLSREDAIRLHRDMWNKIAEYEKNEGRDREYHKRKYLEEQGIDPLDVRHHCFLCEYANQRYLQEYGETDDLYCGIGVYCEYCPLDWSSGRGAFMCEGPSYRWQSSPAEIIANLPERKENEDEREQNDN